MKLNSDHHEMLLNFAERNPQIITNRFVGFNSSLQNKRLWEQLETELNSLGYGVLSAAEYKRRITDWKSKVKAKAAAIERAITGTGGGDGTHLSLTKHEQRLLALMGNKSFKGDDVIELGFCHTSKKRKVDEICTNNENRKLPELSEPEGTTFVTLQTPKRSLIPRKPMFIKVNPLLNSLPDSNLETNSSSSPIQKCSGELEPLTKLSNNPSSTGHCDRQSNHDDSYQSTQEVEATDQLFITPKEKHAEIPRRLPSASTNRRRYITNMSGAIKEMNDETLNVLRNIDKNLFGINDNLKNINETLKIISVKLFDKNN